MKKFTSIMCLVLTAAMLFAFVGCGDDEEPIPTGNNDVNVQVDPEAALKSLYLKATIPGKTL